jgi:tetratricopeptide (TPR) repeat protein
MFVLEETSKHPSVEDICALLADLSSAKARMLYHLLNCPLCLEEAVTRSVEDGDGSGELGPGPDEAQLALLPRGLTAKVLRFERDREEAQKLFEDLMGVPAEMQASRIAGDSRHASAKLAERLLEASAQSASELPAEAERLARLALAVADRLAARCPGGSTAIAQALRVAGWSRVGQARRLLDDPWGAEAAFRVASEAVDDIPIGAVERGVYCHQLGLLYRDQERIDVALGLFTRAAEIYRDLGEQDLLGESLCDKGWTLLEEDARLALRALRPAVLQILPETHRWEALRVRQALALAYGESDPEEAQAMLEASRELAQGVRGTLRWLVAWTDGEISARLGRTEEAIETLHDAVRGLAGAGKWFDAALAMMDLVEVLSDAGRRRRIEELRSEMEQQLAVHLPAPVAMALRVGLRVAGRRTVATSCLVHVRHFIRRARGGARGGYQPSREPARSVSWGVLPASARREICAQVDVDEATAERAAAAIPRGKRELIGRTYQELSGTKILWRRDRAE